MRIRCISCFVPPRREGRCASSRTLRRDAVDADGVARRAHLSRTAKSCGPDAPTLASSRWRQLYRRRWQKSPVTGESTKQTVKTIAQGRPGCSGEPVVTMLVCFSLSHARLRVQRAPGFPCALCFSEGGDSWQDSSKSMLRDRGCISRRHCEE
jgi:hypothetical protein